MSLQKASQKNELVTLIGKGMKNSGKEIRKEKGETAMNARQ
jgi:hypothetical protein